MVIPPAQLAAFWRSLPRVQRDAAQGYYNKIGKLRPGRDIVVEDLGDGAIRVTLPGTTGDVLSDATGEIVSSLQINYDPAISGQFP